MKCILFLLFCVFLAFTVPAASSSASKAIDRAANIKKFLRFLHYLEIFGLARVYHNLFLNAINPTYNGIFTAQKRKNHEPFCLAHGFLYQDYLSQPRGSIVC